MKVGFVEVEDIAQHILDEQKIGKKSRTDKYAIVKDIMKHKTTDAEKCLRESSINLKKSKENLSKVVRINTMVKK